MRILGVIPARGGSKGIPRKNIADLGGKPLLAWSIAAARGAAGLGRILVSTDDPEIAEIAIHYGAEAPFLRPADLANDVAPALPVIQHALRWSSREGYPADAIVYLQPTSPFRSSADIDAAIAELRHADTVVSVVAVPHNMLPESLMLLRADGYLDFAVSAEQRVWRRQDKQVQWFARNGPAVLAVRSKVIEAGQLYGGRIRPVTMPAVRSLDIDTPEDLATARAIWKDFSVGG